jgi:hypothetical protein
VSTSVDDDSDAGYEIAATLEDLGIRFHGIRRRQMPPHVYRAIHDAGQRVLDNYTRVGTACGHEPSPTDENRCAVMICDQSTRRAP